MAAVQPAVDRLAVGLRHHGHRVGNGSGRPEDRRENLSGGSRESEKRLPHLQSPGLGPQHHLKGEARQLKLYFGGDTLIACEDGQG